MSYLEQQIVEGKYSIEELHRVLVLHLKNRCEENLHFSNKCFDEFYKIQMTPLKEPLKKEEKVKLFKLKMDLVHQIKIARFIEYKYEFLKKKKAQKHNGPAVFGQNRANRQFQESAARASEVQGLLERLHGRLVSLRKPDFQKAKP